MLRLSLRQRFLVAPFLGLVTVLALTTSFLLQSEKQNDLIEDISESDLATLSLYTELFTDLSHYHLELYELFNSAGQSVDEGALYDKGIIILDHIFQTTQQMEEIIQSIPDDDSAMTKEEMERIRKEIISYRNAAISSVENTTVSLDRAPIYLSKANNQFSVLHEHFALELDKVRTHIKTKASEQLDETRGETITLGAVGVISAVTLLIVSFVFATVLSRKISKHINKIYGISEQTPMNTASDKSSADEIERLDHAIVSFKKSLIIIREQEKELTLTNQELQSQIEIKLEQENQLRESKQELEKRVLERTASLTQLNKELEQEINQRAQAEQSLRIYQEIILNTDEAILVAEPDGTIIEVNPAYVRISGYDRDELIGHNPRMERSGLLDKVFDQDMWQGIKEQGHWSGEVWNRKKNGEKFPMWVIINAIHDEHGEIQHLIGLYRDISELKKAEARLEQLAFYDLLTNLPNRTLFNEKLRQELASAKRHREKMALLFLDLDNFKDINDTMGHNTGDELLVKVGNRLGQCLRDTDLIARLGGDEFNIAVTQLKNSSGIEEVAKKIINAVSAPYFISGKCVRVGVSIGISIYPEHSTSIETLKKYSDMAMYKAKSLGKNQFQIFTPELQLNREQRVELESALSNALASRAFTLSFQPIIDLESNKVVSAEALIRWRHNGKDVPPDQFIPIAEESDLINRIDCWVLQKACRSVLLWNEILEEPISVNVNLSSKFFQRFDTPEIIEKIVDRTGMDGSLLSLEITETAVISDANITKKNIEIIKKMGVKIVLDDFGTGFSSLNYLTQFSMDEIKIDRSFVRDLHENSSNHAVVDALIKLANKLGIFVVAEGVESHQHHDYLKQSGCHYSQGYFYSKPLAEQEFIRWLTGDDVEFNERFNIKSVVNNQSERERNEKGI